MTATIHPLPSRAECGRIVLQSAEVIRFPMTHRLTFASPSMAEYTDVWVDAPSFEEAVRKAMLDSSVPWSWKLVGWSRTP